MAETIGSLVDKLSIVEHRMFHLQEQITRRDVDQSHRLECQRKWEVLGVQKGDLIQELDELWGDLMEGRKQLKVYRQFKLYNDKRYRRPSGDPVGPSDEL